MLSRNLTEVFLCNNQPGYYLSFMIAEPVDILVCIVNYFLSFGGVGGVIVQFFYEVAVVWFNLYVVVSGYEGTLHKPGFVNRLGHYGYRVR